MMRHPERVHRHGPATTACHHAGSTSVRLLFVACCISVTGCGRIEADIKTVRDFTPQDEVAVRALEQAYRNGWLTNDSAAVMGTLTERGSNSSTPGNLKRGSHDQGGGTRIRA